MKKTIKYIFSIATVFAMLFGATACGSDDDTVTTEPETTAAPTESVSACEVNGHTWVDATCETAKTCSVCGMTEGEALGHTWVDANYQAPKTCSVCGATEGEPLVASFVEHGLSVLSVDEAAEYSYVTTCYGDTSQKTTATVYLSGYNRFESDETHEAAEGYEWITLTIKMRFDDENANAYGMTVTTCNENYYDIEEWDASGHEVSDGVRGYTVNYNGIEYTECLYTSSGLDFGAWEGSTCWVTLTEYYRVPVGYDGIVLGLRDSGVEWPDGQHIYDIADENTLFFRLG